jgi:hypothetical protein
MCNRNATLVGAVALLALLLGAGSVCAADLSSIDLSGDWYVLIHYKDDRSEDKTITKFKDFAWSVDQGPKKIIWSTYPYVLFNEDLEGVRREAMRRHLPWEPTAGLWDRIRSRIGVSSRAASKKTLRGSPADGFESLPPMGAGAANVMTFSVDWNVSFAPEKVRIQITDSLSGGAGLGGMEDSTVYEITEQVSDDEFHGSYAESTKHGTFRMVKSKKREVLN